MLFFQDLEEIIFQRHLIINSDELIILSGYIGPEPVRRLSDLPFESTVIFGMYGESGITNILHNSILNIKRDLPSINILYSNIPIHSKCYIWKRQNEIIHVLVGSANFSRNGLNTPYREILAETTQDTFGSLQNYLDTIFKNTIECNEATINRVIRHYSENESIDPDICRMTLLNPTTNEVQNANGLNWGQSRRAHTNPNDANIPIRAEHIRNYPNLFPPKQIIPTINEQNGRPQRHNDAIEIIWDDGVVMRGLLEGNYIISGTLYPKQISSFPEKRILGSYFRNRIGIEQGERVTRRYLERYGRTHIDVSFLSEGLYYLDFSVG